MCLSDRLLVQSQCTLWTSKTTHTHITHSHHICQNSVLCVWVCVCVFRYERIKWKNPIESNLLRNILLRTCPPRLFTAPLFHYIRIYILYYIAFGYCRTGCYTVSLFVSPSLPTPCRCCCRRSTNNSAVLYK